MSRHPVRRRGACLLLFCLLLFCLILPLPGVAVDAGLDPAATATARHTAGVAEARPRIGLVLGGGGARGAAHIGVLQVLEEHRIPVDSVAGTSMGALVGGMYATGQSPVEMEALMRAIDWGRLFRDSTDRAQRPMRRKRDDIANLGGAELGFRDGRLALPRGALQGHRLLLWLRRQTLGVAGIDDFSRLPLPFAAVATDIVSGERVVMRSGDLALAMRASMAVPGVFAPIRVDERLMVDGGVVENVPVRVAREQGAERLIVVDVGAPLLREEQLGSLLSVTVQMISVLMKHESDRVLAELHPDDVLIRPQLGDFSSADFENSLSTIAIGRAAAEAALPDLLPLALDEAAWSEHLAARRASARDALQVARYDVDDERSRSALRLRKLLGGLQPGALDLDTLEARLDEAMAGGDYERINYRLLREAESAVLQIQPIDKGWGPGYVHFGFALGDDFSGRSSYQASADLRLTGLDERGREWRSRVNLGQRSGLFSEIHQPFGGDGRYYLQAFGLYEASRQPAEVLGVRIAEFTRREFVAGGEIGLYPNPRWQLSAGLQLARRQLRRAVGSPDVQRTNTANLGSLVLAATYDSLDDIGFPTRGARFDIAGQVYRQGLGSDNSADVLRLRFDAPIEFEAMTMLLGVRADWALANTSADETLTFLGGFGQLSGLGDSERIGSRAFVARSLFYRRINDLGLATLPLYLGGSLEAGQNWLPFQRPSTSSLDYGASLFFGVDSPLGPVYLGYGRLSSGDGAAFLRVGGVIDDLRR
jgi:NTE family protein